MPSWFLLPGIIIATMAAIIASQAMISGSYTLINEGINLNFWARIAVRQPTEMKGQIYIPRVKNILLDGCILIIVYFQSSTHMEAAYGFSITITMLMTTFLLAHFLFYRLKWNKFAVLGLFLLFTIIESSFFIANVAKNKERWMFLFFELFIFMVMYVWHHARFIHKQFVKYVDLGQYSQLINELSSDTTIPQFSTHLIYLTKSRVRHEIDEKNHPLNLLKKT